MPKEHKPPKVSIWHKNIATATKVIVGIILLVLLIYLFGAGVVRDLAISAVSFVLGMWIFNKYFLPKMAANMGTDLIHALQRDPEIKPLIDKAKDIMNRLDPFVKQLKDVDLNGIQKDLKPLVETVKKIDPETVEQLLTILKDLAKGFQEKLEKPKIPDPD